MIEQREKEVGFIWVESFLVQNSIFGPSQCEKALVKLVDNCFEGKGCAYSTGFILPSSSFLANDFTRKFTMYKNVKVVEFKHIHVVISVPLDSYVGITSKYDNIM